MNEFNTFILEHNVLKILDKPVVLKSGQESFVYLNWRNITENINLFDQLLHFILKFIKENNIQADCFYGVPEGCSKIGLFVHYFWLKIPQNYNITRNRLAMGRGLVKNHGEIKDRFFIGSPRGEVVVIEDVCTTGESLLNTVKTINSLPDAKVTTVIVLTDRMQKDLAVILEKDNIKYYSMSNINALLEMKVGSRVTNYLTKGIE